MPWYCWFVDRGMERVLPFASSSLTVWNSNDPSNSATVSCSALFLGPVCLLPVILNVAASPDHRLQQVVSCGIALLQIKLS